MKSLAKVVKISKEFFMIFYMYYDEYYMAYKPITLPCVLFMFIKMKVIHYHSRVMFAMKSMSICND